MNFAGWLRTAVILVLIVSVLWASGIAPQAYNLIQSNGSNVTRAQTLNFQNGTNTTVSCSTSAGVTTCAYSSSGGGGGVSKYSQTFSSVTSVTLTHSLGTTTVLVQCYDASSPPNQIIPQNIAVTSSSVVTVTFSASQSGTCVVVG